MNHFYHMTLDLETINKLHTAGGVNNKKQISHLLKKIVEIFFHKIEKKHFSRHTKENSYELINSNTNVPRKEIWFSIDKDIYKRLKQVRADLNEFSVAKIIRKAIQWYLDMMDKKESLDASQKNWKKTKKSYFVTPKDLFQHMLNFITNSNEKSNRYIVIYSDRATPEAIYLY